MTTIVCQNSPKPVKITAFSPTGDKKEEVLPTRKHARNRTGTASCTPDQYSTFTVYHLFGVLSMADDLPNTATFHVSLAFTETRKCSFLIFLFALLADASHSTTTFHVSLAFTETRKCSLHRAFFADLFCGPSGTPVPTGALALRTVGDAFLSDIRLTASDIHFVHDILRLATAFQPQYDIRLRRIVFSDRRGRRSLRAGDGPFGDRSLRVYQLFIIHHSLFIIHLRVARCLRTVGGAGPYAFIIHHSSFIIHHSSSFIIHHSSFIIHHSFVRSALFLRGETHFPF